MGLPRLLTQSRNDTGVSNKLLTPVCRLAMTQLFCFSGCLKIVFAMPFFIVRRLPRHCVAMARNDSIFLFGVAVCFSGNLKTQNSSYNIPNCFSISFITWLNSACSFGVHTSPCAFGLMSDNGKIRILCMVYGEKRCFPQ